MGTASVANKELTPEGREELALALVLLKDFKSDGKWDPDITLQILSMADFVGVKSEFEKMLTQIPPMKIEPRYG